MAWSRPAFTGPLALMLTAFLSLATAATITHDFNITWVTANPDGLMARPVIGINGQWPIPRIDVNVGDRLIINVLNLLGNQSTSLHFHGMYFAGQTHMDGSSQVSQCAIPPGSSFTYNFTVDQPGTYWYHSHAKGQYPDGLRGPFIVHDPNDPFRGQYDEEIVLTVSDWYHDQVPELIKFLMSKTNPTGAEPVPQSALMNDTQNLTVSVQPGKTYFFRMVNMGAFAGQYVWFEGHNITIVEVDGVYTQPKVANMLYIATAQRYSFLLTTRNDTSANFPFISSMDTSLFDKIPEDLHQNVTGWLSYNSANVNPEPTFVETYDFFDDLTLVAYDNQTMLGEPDQIITLNVMMDNLGDGANYAFFNNITYVSPKVPTVYTALSAGDLATDASVYGDYTNSYVLKKDQIVQVVVNNLDSGRHPFHLHGHEFQALYRSDDGAGTFDEAGLTESSYPAIPMRRDTLVLYPEGFFVFRFKASNPGVWLLHCHIEWHVVSGLLAIFVENPLDLQKTLTVPQNHLDTCAAAGIPTKGNAAGNTQNYLDLTGQNAPPAPLPAGFTTRGIIAFVFSTLCGILGVATVAWYGFADAGEGAKGPAETNSSSGVRTPAASEMLEPMTPAAAGLVEVREEITVQSSAGRA